MSTASAEPQTAATLDSLRLRRLSTPAKLLIPCYGSADSELAGLKQMGTLVRRGESLVEHSPHAIFVPFSPVDAKIIEQTSVSASGAGRLPAIAIEPVASSSVVETSPIGPAATEDLIASVAGVGAATLADRLAAKGVWADRWASPNLLSQLRGPSRKPIDTVYCNILDEDPTVPLQAHFAAERAADVIAGILALASATGATKAVAIIAYDAPAETWEKMGTAAPKSLRLVAMRNDYPQANPTLIALELAGRRLRPGQLPIDQGMLILDAVAAAGVARALVLGEPIIDSPLAVHDYLSRETHFVTVPVGMSVGDVLRQLKIPLDDVELRAGCPLREVKITSDCVVGGAELTIAVVPTEAPAVIEPCIRCAWCVEGCPVRIRPAGLIDAAQQDDLYLAGQYGLDACIECGICSFVCPSHLPLLGSIRILRNMQEGSRKGRKS